MPFFGTYCSYVFLSRVGLIVIPVCVFRFVCGEKYFSAVADALESAEQEIFIMDWW